MPEFLEEMNPFTNIVMIPSYNRAIYDNAVGRTVLERYDLFYSMALCRADLIVELIADLNAICATCRSYIGHTKAVHKPCTP